MSWSVFFFSLLIHLTLKTIALLILWNLVAPLIDANPMPIPTAILIVLAIMLFSLKIEIKGGKINGN